MDLRAFKARLQRKFPEPPSWLFVCEGSPLDCRALVIGANPARSTGKPFWETYWNDDYGLKKTQLLADLGSLMRKDSRRRGLTPTRKRLEELRNLVVCKILDTTSFYKTQCESENFHLITSLHLN